MQSDRIKPHPMPARYNETDSGSRSEPDAQTYFNAMRDLRSGRVSADDFRAVMGMLRREVGAERHHRLKAEAAAQLARS